MFREIKYLIFIVVIFVFIFFVGKYYFSNKNKKNSFRTLSNINQKINLYSQNIPILENNTQNIIEYVKNNKTKKRKDITFGN